MTEDTFPTGLSEAMPDKHVPAGTELKAPDRSVVRFACAYETVWKGDFARSEYKTFAGPFPTLPEALDNAPPKDSLEAIAKRAYAVVVRLDTDGTDKVLYRWRTPVSEPHHWKREPS